MFNHMKPGSGPAHMDTNGAVSGTPPPPPAPPGKKRSSAHFHALLKLFGQSESLNMEDPLYDLPFQLLFLPQSSSTSGSRSQRSM